MKISNSIEQAVISGVKRILAKEIGDMPIQVSISEINDFEGSWTSHSQLFRASTAWSCDGSSGVTDVIAKRWERNSIVAQFFGREKPIERLLFDNGFFDHQIPGIHVPIVGSAISDGEDWVILEEISDEISEWNSLILKDDSSEIERLFVDRLARLHVEWESIGNQSILEANRHWLVSQETKIRWGDRAFRVSLGGQPLDKVDPPSARQHIENLGKVFGDSFLRFLDSLPDNDRELWKNLMMYRDPLIDAAADLPRTLLHGDLILKNTGYREIDGQKNIVLFDWELAGIGSASFDLVYFLGRLRPLEDILIADRLELLDYYYDRYRAAGGSSLSPSMWQRSCDIAVAHYGVAEFPAWAGIALQTGDSKRAQTVERMTEVVRQAFRNPGLAG